MSFNPAELYRAETEQFTAYIQGCGEYKLFLSLWRLSLSLEAIPFSVYNEPLLELKLDVVFLENS